MIGMAREVALEERLVDRDVLDPHDPVGPLDLDDPVHQQKRIPVRDHVQDPADVHRHASDALSGAVSQRASAMLP